MLACNQITTFEVQAALRLLGCRSAYRLCLHEAARACNRLIKHASLCAISAMPLREVFVSLREYNCADTIV